MNQINGLNLRILRTRQGYTLSALAKWSGVNQSTIHKIETGRRPHPHLSTVKKLADKLGVAPEILMGEDIEDDADTLALFARKSKFTFKMLDDARNSLELVAVRYGLEPAHILHLAPFLFHCAAEASLRERQERLDAIRDQLRALEGVRPLEHLSNLYDEAWRGGDALEIEQRSIDKRDLFGLFASSDAEPDDYEPSEQNPWVQFLKSLADQCGDGVKFDYWTPRWNHFAYSVGREDALALVGDNEEAADHIVYGRARLHELPDSTRQAGPDAVAAWVIDAGEQAIKEFEKADILGFGGKNG